MSIRRFWLISGLFSMIVAGTMLLSTVVWGETYNDRIEPQFPYGDILSSLPEDAKDLLPVELLDADTSSALINYADSDYLWNFCVVILQKGFSGCLQLFASLLGLVLVCGVLTRLSEQFLTDKSALLELAILLIASLQIYTSVYYLFDLVRTVIEQIDQYMSALMAILCSVFLMMGNSGVALIGTTWMGLLWTISEKVCFSFFFPLMQISFGGTLISSASPEMNLRPILGSLRKICMTTLIIFMTVITLILSYQTSLAAAADSLSMRGIKFAASNMVPLIGGMFSDTLRTISTTFSLVKKTVGVTGLIGLLAALAVPLTSLFGAKYGLALASTAAELLDVTPLKPILNESESLINYLIAVLLMFGVFYLIMLGVLLQTASAIG